MATTNRSNKMWITFYMILVLLGFMAITIKLFYLQVIKGEHYSNRAYIQQTDDRKITPERGTIYDTNGKKLTQSTSVNIIRVVPSDIKDKKTAAEKLAGYLKMSKKKVLEKISKKVSSIQVADEVTNEVASEILKWISDEGVKGIYIDENVKRIYPYNNLAAQVLGVTGTDSQGLSGLELYYDSLLSGVEGKIVGNYDVNGRETPYKEEQYISAENGKDLVLTLDATIQQIAEKELKKTVIENVADNGTAIVMNPNTGEVLAMASYPSFDINNAFLPNKREDVNNWSKYSLSKKNNVLNNMWKNLCISDAYEPGSCFKMLTAAAALEEDIVELDTPGEFYCPGYHEVAGWKIKCWRHPRTHGSESLREGIQNSCNPVFMQISERMSKETFTGYLAAYNLGKKTGIDLPGEATGIIHSLSNITPLDMATTSFGQTISVTPLQLVAAVSSTINGGSYMKPYVVKAIKSQDNSYYKEIKPTVVKKIVSEDVSRSIRSAMETTVTQGTASGAKIAGYKIGGKTATAEQGRGTNLWYSAGFIGVAPIEAPELIVSVYLNNPVGPQGHQGGLLCGPVVGNILSESLRYLDIDPNYTVTENKLPEKIVPNVQGKTYTEAKTILKNAGFRCNLQGNANGKILNQIPKYGASLIENSTIQLYTVETSSNNVNILPDVRGKSMIEAITSLSNSGFNIKVIGSGYAMTQSVMPGTSLERGSIITVKFSEEDEMQ